MKGKKQEKTSRGQVNRIKTCMTQFANKIFQIAQSEIMIQNNSHKRHIHVASRKLIPNAILYSF